jgi:YfiH family protein
MNILTYLYPNWPAPKNIRAVSTKRLPGHSSAPYDCNNLALHVGDNPDMVLANRLDLVEALDIPTQPDWLEQTHSTRCVVVEDDNNRLADAAITRSSNHVLAILTADCLPVLLCNKQGSEIAAVHAGWRGLLNGVIENTLSSLHSQPKDLMAWIGPAICPRCYEVGDDVREAFVDQYPMASNFFTKRDNKWLANLPGLAELILNNLSVSLVFQSHACTYENKIDYFSYRRDAQTGRIASLIWFNTTNQD